MKPTNKMTLAELQAVISEKETVFKAQSEQLETAREAREKTERELRETKIELEGTKQLLSKALEERNKEQEINSTLESTITSLRVKLAEISEVFILKDKKIEAIKEELKVCKSNYTVTVEKMNELANRGLWDRIINKLPKEKK